MPGLQENQESPFVRNVTVRIGIEKKCTKCGIEKELSEFNQHKEAKDEKRCECALCQRKESKVLYIKNRENVIKRTRQWALKNPDKTRKAWQKWQKNNPEKANKSSATWKLNNPEKVKILWKRGYIKKKNTPRGKINIRMGNGIRKSLSRGAKRVQHWEVILGYTTDQLKTHLEKQFKDGMSWEEFMLGNIHIDHKIPLAAHNFETLEDADFKKAWALNNLQPMWARENIQKSDKLNNPFQPSLCIGV